MHCLYLVSCLLAAVTWRRLYSIDPSLLEQQQQQHQKARKESNPKWKLSTSISSRSHRNLFQRFGLGILLLLPAKSCAFHSITDDLFVSHCRNDDRPTLDTTRLPVTFLLLPVNRWHIVRHVTRTKPAVTRGGKVESNVIPTWPPPPIRLQRLRLRLPRALNWIEMGLFFSFPSFVVAPCRARRQREKKELEKLETCVGQRSRTPYSRAATIDRPTDRTSQFPRFAIIQTSTQFLILPLFEKYCSRIALLLLLLLLTVPQCYINVQQIKVE